jgi:ABC-type sugar transport system permease subunit
MLCIFLLPAVLLVALLIFLPVILNVYYSMFK